MPGTGAELRTPTFCARGQHGWWQGCAELGLAGYPPYGPDSDNLILILSQTPADPISGSAPLRASLCEIERIERPDAAWV